MPRPRTITDQQRAAILTDAQTGNLSRAAVAREHGVSPDTVTRIVREAGAVDVFDRTTTARATEAKQADNRSRRAVISSRLLTEATEALDDIHREFLAFSFGGKENTYNEHVLPGPPTGDRRNLMQVASLALQRHVDLERVDADQGADQLRSLLGDVAERLGITGA